MCIEIFVWKNFGDKIFSKSNCKGKEVRHPSTSHPFHPSRWIRDHTQGPRSCGGWRGAVCGSGGREKGNGVIP